MMTQRAQRSAGRMREIVPTVGRVGGPMSRTVDLASQCQAERHGSEVTELLSRANFSRRPLESNQNPIQLPSGHSAAKTLKTCCPWRGRPFGDHRDRVCVQSARNPHSTLPSFDSYSPPTPKLSSSFLASVLNSSGVSSLSACTSVTVPKSCSSRS